MIIAKSQFKQIMQNAALHCQNCMASNQTETLAVIQDLMIELEALERSTDIGIDEILIKPIEV